MAINVNLANLSTLNNTSILQQSNSNFSIIQTALLNALSTNGQTPNQMQSTLDMNNNQILNLPPPATVNSPARLTDVVTNPTIVVPAIGTSGSVVGLLNGNNTYSGTSTFTGSISSSNVIAITNAVTANPSPTLSMSLGGASVSGNIPLQVTPTSQPFIVAGTYSDSTTSSGGLFQVASWLTQTGSRPSVAVFGQAEATGTGECWGGNFIGYSNVSGTTALGVEIDAGTLVSGAIVYNALLVTNNAFNNVGAYIQCQSNNTGTNANGLVFNVNSGHQPIAINLIATSGAITCTNGINFSTATFSGNTIISNGFTLGSVGNIGTGGIGIANGSITFAGFTSNTSSINVTNTGVLQLNSFSGAVAFSAGTGSGSAVFSGSSSGTSTLGVNSTGQAFLTSSNGALLVNTGGGNSGTITLAGSSSGTSNITVNSTATQVIVGTLNAGGLITGSFWVTPGPVTNTAASYTASASTPSVIFNTAATCTVTMPAGVGAGTWVYFITKAAQAINSAASNIVPATSTTAGTAILAATAGKFAALQFDGTNWQVMMAN